jgi:hypothetical protein
MMKMIKKTKKLKQAVQLLADEGFSDTSDEAWYEALKAGKIKTENVYKAMLAYGMKWDVVQGYWYRKARRMPFVKTMFSIARKIDARLDKEQDLIKER